MVDVGVVVVGVDGKDGIVGHPHVHVTVKWGGIVGKVHFVFNAVFIRVVIVGVDVVNGRVCVGNLVLHSVAQRGIN